MALPTSAWQEHTRQGHTKPSVSTLGTRGKHLLTCPAWVVGNVWSLGFTSPSNKLNNFVSPWNQFLLITHTELGTTAFEYLHPANKIYVPWKAKKATISCLPTFIVSFLLAPHKQPGRRQCSWPLRRGSFLLCQLWFRKSSAFFIAFIYYICKIYLSNDRSLFGAPSLGE